MYSICVVPGDGIGPEVTDCARRVLQALEAASGGLAFSFERHPAGLSAYREGGDPLPAGTLEAARSAEGVLVGAMDAARVPADAPSPLRGLRTGLGVHVSLRPSRTTPGVAGPGSDVDTLVVREVTEGMYSGIEYRVGTDAACGVRLVTRQASTRAARIAFHHAAERRGKVTALHKLGALKVTDALFLEAVEGVARQFPQIEYETRNVDACALEMVREPGRFDVILATNAFGDIISDVAAGLTGGLGLAPSACVGDRWAYFEPVHGAAPDIAGRGVANPVAAIRSAAMMLRHLGEHGAADAIEAAVGEVLASGSPRTPDLGGTATSEEVTDAVVRCVSAI